MGFVAGDTFLLNEPGSSKSHLYIVPCAVPGDADTILAVPLNTVTAFTDRTLILHAGEHPFIKHETAVAYDRMREIDVASLTELERVSLQARDPLFARRESVVPALLARLQQGALQSDLAPIKLVKKLSAYLGQSSS